MLLRKANDIANNSSSSMSDLTSGPLADKLSQYAQMLASQGSMLTALNYLGSSNEVSTGDESIVVSRGGVVLKPLHNEL